MGIAWSRRHLLGAWVGGVAPVIGALYAAEPARVVDLDFSLTQAGCVPDRISPGSAPVVVPTYSVYGRLRGASAIPDREIRYPSMALGRGGELNALRLGTDREGLGPVGPMLQTGKPFSLEMWVYVYDVRPYFWGALLNIPPGPVHGGGFSLGFQKAKWSREGWLEWRWGKGGKGGSEVFWHKGFAPGQWHQVVISQDASTFALYIDGELSDRREATLFFGKENGPLMIGRPPLTPNVPALDFKVDQLTFYDGALSDDEVKAHYVAGVSAWIFTAEREAQLSALKLEIPHDRYGYFRTGQTIPVRIDESSEADELRVNGETYVLPLKAPVTLAFADAGFQEIRLALAVKDRILKQVVYPVAIVPFDAASSKLGVSELADRQPEVTALGMRLNRVTVDWAELEPVKGAYDWTRLDAVMKRSQALGAETILCLTGIPTWEDRADGALNLPADMARFRKIWRLLANRYDGVTLFEVWNATTCGGELKGTREQRCRDYATLLRAASEVVRQEVSDAKMLAGRIDLDNAQSVAVYLHDNAADCYDIFSLRQTLSDPVATYRKTPWSADIVRVAGKPVWCTVYGNRQAGRAALLPDAAPDAIGQAPGIAPSTVDEWTAATQRIQDILLQLSDGIERIILDAGPSVYEPFNDGTTGLPGMQGLALAVFNGLVGQDAALSRLPDAPTGTFAFRFQNPGGGRGLVLFAVDKPVGVSVGECTGEPVLLDLFGNVKPIISRRVCIVAAPVYLLNVETVSTEE